ncbi:hypothetical protein M885DRAFT_503923 [Pelagophyceae sp. CCMP2097]|nr:hypothetical protein M885DRAFT_503923 [Pelagophyceae sp. CCMP2097]|mmetsp:Transcript_20706/g.71117  ORF Transcript_20706/g.71117 Transcript_20706/m.71117 type:complete len:148 (+) Transcript_20706:43-486(+)
MLRVALRCLLFAAAVEALISRGAPGASRCGALIFAAPIPAETLVGRSLRVEAVRLVRSGEVKRMLLKCYSEAGDPYGVPVDYSLLHNDVIQCMAFADFSGQTWVQHSVLETQRGVIPSGRAPREEPYLVWSTRDLVGHRWLVETEEP